MEEKLTRRSTEGETLSIAERRKSCYLCKNLSSTLAFTKLGHKIYKCLNCDLYFLDFKGPYDQFLHSYYQKGYFNGDKNLRAYADYEGDKKTVQKNMRKYLKSITQFKKSGKLLDIGCAMGFLLELAAKTGFDPHGIDVSDYAVKIAQKRFPDKIILSPLSKANLKNNYFDVITMFDIIEHLETPREDLIKVREALKDDGILVIQTGDSDSLWARSMRKNWHFFAPPQHLFFFSHETIKELLREAGFKVIKIEKDGKWITLRYLFHMLRYMENNGLGDSLYKLVANNLLGKIPIYLRFNDNMIVYAKKS